jgi:hypothetical protein
VEFFWYHTEGQLRGSIPNTLQKKNGEKREEKKGKKDQMTDSIN